MSNMFFQYQTLQVNLYCRNEMENDDAYLYIINEKAEDILKWAEIPKNFNTIYISSWKGRTHIFAPDDYFYQNFHTHTFLRKITVNRFYDWSAFV